MWIIKREKDSREEYWDGLNWIEDRAKSKQYKLLGDLWPDYIREKTAPGGGDDEDYYLSLKLFVETPARDPTRPDWKPYHEPWKRRPL